MPTNRDREISEVNLVQTHTLASDATVGASSSQLVAATNDGVQRQIILQCTAESVRIGVNATPTASQGELLEVGDVYCVYTDQAVNAIRAGGSNATVTVNVYTF
jgi:hypothetical protein